MALTTGRIIQSAGSGRITPAYDVAEDAVIYKGALLGIDSADDRLKPLADSETTKFVGYAYEAYGSEFPLTGVATAGQRQVACMTDMLVLLPTTGVSVGDVSAQGAAYAADDEEVTDDDSLGPQVGRFIKFESASSAWVLLGASVLASASGD